MEDLDKVLRQKPTTVRALKKGRPKTVFCDDSALARSPVKGLLGKSYDKREQGEKQSSSSKTREKSVRGCGFSRELRLKRPLECEEGLSKAVIMLFYHDVIIYLYAYPLFPRMIMNYQR